MANIETLLLVSVPLLLLPSILFNRFALIVALVRSIQDADLVKLDCEKACSFMYSDVHHRDALTQLDTSSKLILAC